MYVYRYVCDRVQKNVWIVYRPGFFIAEPLFRAVPQVEERLKNFIEFLIDTYTTQKKIIIIMCKIMRSMYRLTPISLYSVMGTLKRASRELKMRDLSSAWVRVVL